MSEGFYAPSIDWRKQLHERLRAINARKATQMEDEEVQELKINEAPEIDPGIYAVVSLGWGIRVGGQIIATGPKTEMTKTARANARLAGAKTAHDVELHIQNTAGKITRKEYF